MLAPSIGIAELDETQRISLESCAPACRVSVVGAPGTGKTSVLSAVVQREVMGVQESGRIDMPRIAVITQDRRAAAELRSRLSLALGGLPENGLCPDSHGVRLFSRPDVCPGGGSP